MVHSRRFYNFILPDHMLGAGNVNNMKRGNKLEVDLNREIWSFENCIEYRPMGLAPDSINVERRGLRLDKKEGSNQNFGTD